jgi:hypothetical protein
MIYKILPLILVFLAALVNLQAQDLTSAQIPDAVTSALKQGYPQAAEVRWKLKKELYKADFKVGKTDHELWLTKTGVIEKHRFELKSEKLPAAVTAAIKRDFSSYTVGKCEQTDEHGTSIYKVDLKSAAGKKHVKFSGDGKVIVKEDKEE